MASNTNLTRDIAVLLVKGQEVICPNCGNCKLTSRYTYKNTNVEYRCKECGEVYHPCKMI